MRPQAIRKADSLFYRAVAILPTAILLALIFGLSIAHWALLL
jgi:hypothetical protein